MTGRVATQGLNDRQGSNAGINGMHCTVASQVLNDMQGSNSGLK
jgi:hypothetical protein